MKVPLLRILNSEFNRKPLQSVHEASSVTGTVLIGFILSLCLQLIALHHIVPALMQSPISNQLKVWNLHQICIMMTAFLKNCCRLRSLPRLSFCLSCSTKLAASPILFVPCLFIQWERGLAGLESKLVAIIKPVVSTSTTPNPGSNQQIQTHSYNHVPDTKIWACSCSSCQHVHLCALCGLQPSACYYKWSFSFSTAWLCDINKTATQTTLS